MNNKRSHLKLSGGQAVLESLRAEEVSHVFGLIGSATMELFDALYDAEDIRFIDVRDERTGTHMADGYARASGKTGIIIAGQNGPGATNLITGIAQAKAAFSPIISIAGDIATEHKGMDAFQDIDQQSLFEPIPQTTFTVTQPSLIPNILKTAFNLATMPRCGPVHINLPRDILANMHNFDKFTKHKKKSFPLINKKDVIKILDLIFSSKQAVIIAGGGVKNSESHNEVIKLATLANIPIVSSAGHGDAIPFNERLYAGQMGPRGNPIASKLVKNADVILALGTRLGFNSTFFSNEIIDNKSTIIQVDIDKKSLGRYFKIELGICNDVQNLIGQLLVELIKRHKHPVINDWTNEFLNQKTKYLKDRDKNADLLTYPIQPTGLFKILRDTFPQNTAVTLDAGTLCLQATDMINYFKTRSFFTPLDFGLVGFSFACGLGVKLAKPECPVVSLMGDGGFGMSLSEISTAVQHKINTVTIIMNNQSWGAEKAYQKDFYNKRYIGSNIKSPPFEKIAELYGAKGYRVSKINKVKDAIEDALDCKKPAIINIDIDPEALYSFRKDSFTHRVT